MRHTHLRTQAEDIYNDRMRYYTHEDLAKDGQFPTVDHAEKANKAEGMYWYDTDSMITFRTRDMEVLKGRVMVWSDTNFDHTARVYKVAPISTWGSPNPSLDYGVADSLDQARRIGRHLTHVMSEKDGS